MMKFLSLHRFAAVCCAVFLSVRASSDSHGTESANEDNHSIVRTRAGPPRVTSHVGTGTNGQLHRPQEVAIRVRKVQASTNTTQTTPAPIVGLIVLLISLFGGASLTNSLTFTGEFLASSCFSFVEFCILNNKLFPANANISVITRPF
jgi:hypothetical protein